MQEVTVLMPDCGRTSGIAANTGLRHACIAFGLAGFGNSTRAVDSGRARPGAFVIGLDGAFSSRARSVPFAIMITTLDKLACYKIYEKSGCKKKQKRKTFLKNIWLFLLFQQLYLRHYNYLERGVVKNKAIGCTQHISTSLPAEISPAPFLGESKNAGPGSNSAGFSLPAWVTDLSLLGSVFDNLPLGILIVDLEGRIIYCNDAQSKIDGMEKSFIIGKMENDIYGPYLGPGIMRACQQTGEPLLGYVCQYRTVRGRLVNGAYWVYPCCLAGKIVGSLGFTKLLPSKKPLLALPYSFADEETAEREQAAEAEQPIIGSDPAFRKALNVIQTTASSPSPVLIAGETGTGKEKFVQAIRTSGNRHDKPYQAINCSAIPATLLEGILFGATKGSFTGAVERPGLFEEANGGIVYLDEIDSMPLGLQPKLLRVIQEMRVRRLGSAIEHPIDVKIISSTSTSPAEALARGRLRPDLYYRLAVITVTVPPLRERLGDLDALIRHFIDKYNRQLNKNVHSVDDALRAYLQNYRWPGNVRELEHVIAGAINLAGWETTLHMHHIPEHHRLSINQGIALAGAQARTLKPGIALHPSRTVDFAAPGPYSSSPAATLAVQEQNAISAALSQAGGKLAKAAATLGISRQLLCYKMKKYGLERENYLKPLGAR
jgi:arginine utilization regulatory protein